MIKANELRIGNWVKNNAYKENNIRTITQLFDCQYDELDPIPLTLSILEKAGFSELMHGDRYIALEVRARIYICYHEGHSSKCSIMQDGKMIDFPFSSHRYVHQLQNLYFSFQGEELEINL